jgi:hypothetical protein
METCPHGARIVVEDDTIVFIDDCATCTELLADLGFPPAVRPLRPASAL